MTDLGNTLHHVVRGEVIAAIDALGRHEYVMKTVLPEHSHTNRFVLSVGKYA